LRRKYALITVSCTLRTRLHPTTSSVSLPTCMPRSDTHAHTRSAIWWWLCHLAWFVSENRSSTVAFLIQASTNIVKRPMLWCVKRPMLCTHQSIGLFTIFVKASASWFLLRGRGNSCCVNDVWQNEDLVPQLNALQTDLPP
jgi:hypothetical protein